MIEYMRLCQKYQIHLISDEIYALTTFPTDDIPNPTSFISLLSIPKDDLIDPSLCHIIHGMSKVLPSLQYWLQDFCANGVRFGVLISQANTDLHVAFEAIGYFLFFAFKSFSLFTLPSSLAMQALSTLLNHPTFLPSFLSQNRTLLIEHYAICTDFLQKNSIPYNPTNAGFFIWADLTKWLDAMQGDTKLEKEREMNSRLLDGGVHLATSEQFYGEEYGWFRITFAVEKNILELGLKR